ncbi:MAG: hypothetical protein DI544_11175 [Sphingomonas taxi]|uniref:MmgE/PrpD N-terminal domain-containing protein n=1 Tax=Sphingomonas taxi TaxID=1549858 RepID=A0A2W5P6C4_9SPHN|nr:MAG: hypothetical protein DI544_11175 [Sphingomonas taxi]
MPDPIDALCKAAMAMDAGPPGERALIGRAVADLLAVAVAGFRSPVLTSALAALSQDGGGYPVWNGAPAATLEDAATLNAAAAHALDFDDLDLASSAHLHAVVIAALCSAPRWPDEDDLLASVRAAIMAAQVIAARLGRGHYGRGWHATATIGTLAATVAVARAWRLPARTTANALALAAAQAGGLRLNFGTGAKALQAGFAAGAALRSVRLAAAGVTGGAVFAPGGFFALYGDPGASSQASGQGIADTRPKLFPCCFATHRLVVAGLNAREHLGDPLAHPAASIIARLPAATLAILRDGQARDAVQAAFSPAYCLSAALRDGPPSLGHFVDPLDDPLVARAARIEVLADDGGGSPGYDMRDGYAELIIVRPGTAPVTFRATRLPGDDDAVPVDDLLRRKIADCLAWNPPAARRLANRVRSLPSLARWWPPSADDGPVSG